MVLKLLRSKNKISLSRRTVWWYIFLTLLCVYAINFYRMYHGIQYKDETKKGPVDLPYVVVHLDFKGAPPKLEYLASILPLLKKNGVNALLMEYEDMFPFENRIFNLSARNRYEPESLKEFIRLALTNGFEVIPLVQTFGHLEFALKLEEFQHLRENLAFPDSLCPSDYRSIALVEDMLTQIVNFHSEISPLKHIHLGCDEVFAINTCDHCLRRKLPTMDLYFSHIETIANIVEKLNPDIKILIWDDMMRNSKSKINWNQVKSYRNIYPVYWDYTPKVKLSHASLFQYHQKFKGIWLSSAFKGADGDTKTLPDLKNRFQNNLSWMTLIQKFKFGGNSDIYNFEGIILTGWSRYSHMDPLVELLPSSIPSLILSLITVNVFKTTTANVIKGEDWMEFYEKHIKYKFMNEFNCNSLIDNHFEKLQCNFQGTDVFNVVSELMEINQNVKNVFDNDEFGLLPKYSYLKFCYFNAISHQELSEWCYKTLQKLSNIEKELRNTLSKYYDAEVIDEYVYLKVRSSETRIKNYLARANTCANTFSWSRGPLKIF